MILTNIPIKCHYKITFVLVYSIAVCLLAQSYKAEAQPSIETAFPVEADAVKAIAIYAATSEAVERMTPGEIVFSVSDQSMIQALISSVESDVERTCSRFKANTDAYVYVQFRDGSVQKFELLLGWSHISKLGSQHSRQSCYYVSEAGQRLFARHARGLD